MRAMGWLGILFVACGASLALGGARARRSTRIASHDGTYVVEFEFEPAEVPLNERISAALRVYEGPAGVELAGEVELAVDARMPHHRHGMRVEPSTTRVGHGSFRVEGLALHMPGRWDLYFDVTRGAVTERAQHTLELE